jgi:proline-specific peptidase
MSATIVEGRVPFRGHETWYRVIGDLGTGGLPLLCLHGGPGAPNAAQSPLEPLSADRALVQYDQLGCGNSTNHDDRSLWTVETFVAEVGAVREALGLDRVHVLGSSWGAMLAIEYALTQPPGLVSLVLTSALSSSRLWGDEARRLLAEMPAEVRSTMERHQAAGTTDDPDYEEATMAYYRKHMCRLDPWPEVIFEIHRRRRVEIYEYMWGPSEDYPTGTLKDWDVTPRLDEIRVPTLVTCGEFDEATPRQAETIANAIPGAELVVIPGVAHMAAIEDPDAYFAVVRPFLRRND